MNSLLVVVAKALAWLAHSGVMMNSFIYKFEPEIPSALRKQEEA